MVDIQTMKPILLELNPMILGRDVERMESPKDCSIQTTVQIIKLQGNRRGSVWRPLNMQGL